MAGTEEAPGQYFFQDGVRLKKYRGMDSLDARESFGQPVNDSVQFSHGVSGAVVDKGSVARYIPYLAQSMRHGFQDIGVQSIDGIHNYLVSGKLRFEIRSQAAQKEGGVHDLFSYKKRLFKS